MELTKTDADLLEFITLSEPWSMVCGEFCPKYGSVEAFVARLTTFEHAELLTIEPEPPPYEFVHHSDRKFSLSSEQPRRRHRHDA